MVRLFIRRTGIASPQLLLHFFHLCQGFFRFFHDQLIPNGAHRLVKRVPLVDPLDRKDCVGKVDVSRNVRNVLPRLLFFFKFAQ